MSTSKILLAVGVAAVGSGILFIYFGLFNVAADAPHMKSTYWLMKTVREHSVAVRAHGIEVPSLDDPTKIASGSADYNAMCTGCHRAPGIARSEMAIGMYPQPPTLADVKRDNPAETYWIIKHGLKMSGMPAWGLTHDDGRIWAMVAFLQQLPRLTPAQYQILTARRAGAVGGHAHGDEAEGMGMPGADSMPTDEHGSKSHADGHKGTP